MLRMAHTTHNLIIFYGQWARNGQHSCHGHGHLRVRWTSWPRPRTRPILARTINKQVREQRKSRLLSPLMCQREWVWQRHQFVHSLPLLPPLPPPSMRTLTPQLTFDIVAHTPRMPHCFIYCPATAAFSCFIVGSFISSQSCKNSSLLPLPPLPSPPLCLGVDCRRGWSSQTSVSDAKWAVNNVNNYCHYQLGDKVYTSKGGGAGVIVLYFRFECLEETHTHIVSCSYCRIVLLPRNETWAICDSKVPISPLSLPLSPSLCQFDPAKW